MEGAFFRADKRLKCIGLILLVASREFGELASYIVER